MLDIKYRKLKVKKGTIKLEPFSFGNNVHDFKTSFFFYNLKRKKESF